MLPKLNVSLRLALLQGLTALSLVALGLTLGQVNTQSADHFETFRLAALQARGTQAAAQALLQHKVALDAYTRKADAANAEALNAAKAALATALADKGDFAETAQAYAKAAAEIEAGITLLGRDEAQGLQGALRRAVHDLETQLKDVAAPDAAALDAAHRLTIQMLQMRRLEKDFMLRGDAEKRMGEVARRRAEFLATLAAAPLPEARKETLRTLLASYLDGLRQFTEAATTVHAARGQAHDAYATAVAKASEAATVAADSEARAQDIAQAKIVLIKRTTVLGIVILLLLLTISGYEVARSVGMPVRRLTNTLNDLARGDLNTVVPESERSDEIGEMARAVEVLRSHSVEAERLRAAQAAARADADQSRHKALRDMAQTIERETQRAVDEVTKHTRHLDATANTLAASAELVSQRSSAVASAASESLAKAGTTASAAEQVSASIHEIAQLVARAGAVSGGAVGHGLQTEATMATLNEAVGRINEVAQLIRVIAGQTNLLALNATIEAARAGDAGKGFAVVAHEVKALSTQTGRSVEEIEQQLGAVQKAALEASQQVHSVIEAIREVDGVNTAVAAAIEEQAASTHEISRNIRQTAAIAEDISARISEVAAAAGLSAGQSATVLTTAAQVADGITNLQAALNTTVHTVTDADAADARRGPVRR